MSEYYEPEVLAKVPSVDFKHANAVESDITFYLYSNSAQANAVVVPNTYKFSVDEQKNPLKILVHGYTSNVTTTWYQLARNVYFEKGLHNILLIDWGRAAIGPFKESSANIRPVADFVAEFLLQSEYSLDNIHIIGHSLGSHLAGFIGKSIQEKSGKQIGRITGTDPAGPGFSNIEESLRLNHTDAVFVDVVHTDIHYFGITQPIGHVDFYPNGGRDQPGCPTHKENTNCSHARANHYFLESVLKNNVYATAAVFKDGEVVLDESTNKKVLFGENMSTATRGVYILITNPRVPYLIET